MTYNYLHTSFKIDDQRLIMKYQEFNLPSAVYLKRHCRCFSRPSYTCLIVSWLIGP